MYKLLSLKSLGSRKFITFLSIASIALSLSLFLLVEKVRDGVEEGFTNTISQADLIVGARSGPLQLLLYTVFHMGSATNNIRYSSYEKIKSNPVVAWTIPISLGDSYKGHRVVATTEDFFNHYRFYSDKKIEMAKGQWSGDIFDVVLGASVARKFSLGLGHEVVLSHGVSQYSIMDHEASPFKVRGIMKATGTPLDKAVFISLEAMEAIHLGWERGIPSDEKIDYGSLSEEQLKPSQLTSFILRSKNRIALLHLKRSIGQFKDEPLMGIIPGVTLAQLWEVLDQLQLAFLILSFFVILTGFISVLISLYMSLNERRKEMAILRSIGVSPVKITFLLILEASLISTLGAALGLGLQYFLLHILNPILELKYSFSVPIKGLTQRELYICLGFVFLGPISGIIPGMRAYYLSSRNKTIL